MFAIDVPYIPPQTDTIELVQAEDTTLEPEYLVKTCDETSIGGQGIIDPAGWLINAVLMQAGRQVSSIDGTQLISKVKLTQITNYEHGETVPIINDKGSVTPYYYYPNPGYMGKDTAIFMAEFEGKVYKMQANVIVVENLSDALHIPSPCPETEMIKIDRPLSYSSEL